MNSFSCLQTINNEQYSFCFSAIARVDCPKYYVAVKQGDTLITAFEMKQDSYYKTWVVCQPAPDWIAAEGAALAQMIEKATAKNGCPGVNGSSLHIY